MRKLEQRHEGPRRADASLPQNCVLLTSNETANILKVSRRTLDYWTAGKRPRLSYVKLGKAKRFIEADIARLIETHKVKAA
jgi:hypothetical protein